MSKYRHVTVIEDCSEIKVPIYGNFKNDFDISDCVIKCGSSGDECKADFLSLIDNIIFLDKKICSINSDKLLRGETLLIVINNSINS